MDERDLRASLASIGVQVPGLEYDGRLLDGRKKAGLCAELGIPFPVSKAESLREACSVLWLRHPSRAIELAHTTRLLELAELCSTSSSAIARELAAHRPKKSHKKRIVDGQPYPQLKEQRKMVRRNFVLEPELWAYALEAAKQRGHGNRSKLVRDALWKDIALTVPMAPQFQPRRVQSPNGARPIKRRTG